MTAATFVLILFAHVGPMGSDNSNALTVAEFTTEERCQAAGRAAAKLTGGTFKRIEWACVPK